MKAMGISVTSIPDSPIGNLTRQTVVALSDEEKADLNYEKAIEIIFNASRNEEHAAELQTAVDLASESVRQTLSFTRNTVMPHIRKVIDAYSGMVKDTETVPMPYQIKPVYIHDSVKHGVAASLIDGYANGLDTNPPVQVRLAKLDEATVLSLIEYPGEEEFNEHIKELLTVNNNEGLKQIVEVLEGSRDTAALNKEFAIAMIMVLKALNDPREEVKITLTEYNAQRAVLLTYYSKVVLKIIDGNNHHVRNGILYPMVGSGDPKVILVNGDVYSSMLEQGLTVEVLIGNELTGRKYPSQKLLEPEVIDELTKVYERDRVIRANAHELERNNMIRIAVCNALRDDQQERAKAEEFVIEGDTVTKSWERLRGIVDKVYSTHLRELEPTTIIAAAVVGTWYGHTDAGKIIDIMFETERKHPGLPSGEIALLATLRYITNWVWSQFIIDKKDQLI